MISTLTWILIGLFDDVLLFDLLVIYIIFMNVLFKYNNHTCIHTYKSILPSPLLFLYSSSVVATVAVAPIEY